MTGEYGCLKYFIVDMGSTDFSLLIPSVNLRKNNQVKIRTDDITTLQRLLVLALAPLITAKIWKAVYFD